MKFLNIAVVLACSLFVFSCKDDPVASPTTGTIKGIVRDAITGKPIYNVDVQTTPPSESVSTDSLGQYTITAKEGNYSITASKTDYLAGTVSVRVTNGSTTTANISLSSISSTSNPPTIPVVVAPTEGDTSVGVNPMLKWQCSDPDNDPISYTLYLDTAVIPLRKITDTITTLSYTATNLKDSTFYYWKIVAKDKFGATSTSPVFSFRTAGKVSTLVAYFPFDGTTNDMADNLILDNIPTIRYTDGKNGTPNGALVLDGTSNSFLQYKYNSKLDLPSEFTISAWVHPNQMPSNYTQIAGRWISSGGTLNATYSLTLRKTGVVEGNTHDGKVTSQAISNAAIPLSEWSHIAMVRNYNGDLLIYVNGTLLGVKSSSVASQKSSVLFTVGKYGDFLGSMFNGYIDNLRVYSRALDAKELQSLFLNGN